MIPTETAPLFPETHWSRAEVNADFVSHYIRENGFPYNGTKTRMFLELAGARLDGQRVLDYGGGGGFTSVRLAERGAQVTLVDATAQSLRLAEAVAETRGVAGRVATIESNDVPFDLRGAGFDLVILKDVIEHIDDDHGFMQRLVSCLRPGGRLLLSTHNSWSLNYMLEGAYERWWLGNKGWLGWDPTHVRFYNPRSLSQLAMSAGLRVDTWRSVFIVPYNILSWFTLLRKRIEIGALSAVDVVLGGVAPFNRLGWNVVMAATKVR